MEQTQEAMMDYMKEQFAIYGFSFSEEQYQQFYHFYELLVEKNKVMNLTGITEFHEVVEKHFIDSILVGKVVECESKKVMDMGTGAGFPGIPMKIAFPDCEILLMDSLNKRILFLEEVIAALDLKKIKAVHSRAEELARQKEHREQYDLCVSRAVANLSTLEEYCLPFVKKGGYFVSYKSGEIQQELEDAKKACKRLGGEVDKVVPFTLEESQSKRNLVLIEKIAVTPKAFPRKAGIPSREPLK